MEIKKIRLKNFRNYMDEEIFFSKNINLIFGENAQGKTNIIEALYLLATGKSHRTNNIKEMIRYGEKAFRITLVFEDRGYEQKIEIRYEKDTGKELVVNEVKKEKMSEILGIVPSVLFAPESLLSVKGSPGERRKILDVVLCQINKRYLNNLQKYIRIIKNKNFLLKQIKIKRNAEEQLDIWNESQAITGAEIIKERRDIIRNLEKRMNNILCGISDGKEQVKVNYKTVIEEEQQKVYEKMLEIIKQNKEKEIEQGICLYGPHRDDMEIYVNDKNSRVYCSQGQQRSVALALNIGILEEIEEKIEKTPILLLDDVMSELDIKRQEYLYNFLDKRQTIITSTEKSLLSNVNGMNISFIKIDNGKGYRMD
jgi:DNA replication and repair protein RecF